MKQFFPKPNGLEHGFGSIDVAGLSVVFGAVVSELSVLTPPLTRRDSYARFVAMLRQEAALLERSLPRYKQTAFGRNGCCARPKSCPLTDSRGQRVLGIALGSIP